MGPMAGLGESAAKVFTELGKSAVLSGCCMCGAGDEEGDCTSCIGTDGIVSEPGNSVGPDRGNNRFVRTFGDFLRGRRVECRDVT
jgi:hypothetical protein